MRKALINMIKHAEEEVKNNDISNVLKDDFIKTVEETRLTRNVTGAFLTVYVKGDKKIITNISNFIETYIQAMDEYVNKIEEEHLTNEKSLD